VLDVVVVCEGAVTGTAFVLLLDSTILVEFGVKRKVFVAASRKMAGLLQTIGAKLVSNDFGTSLAFRAVVLTTNVVISDSIELNNVAESSTRCLNRDATVL